MQSLNFNYQHPPFEKTIQLYGDRAGGQGNFDFAGLAELQDIQVVLLKGNSDSLIQPTDWRRFLRLINLAQRLKKPIVLWNLSIVNDTSNKHHTSLALGTAIHNTKLHLLNIPHPIISIFDENYIGMSVIDKELGWMDGKIIVKPDENIFTELNELKQENLRIVDRSSEISNQIVDLIRLLSNINQDILIGNRLESLHFYTETNCKFN